MKYRVIGVQYYFYDTDAESEADARAGFGVMMHHGTTSEIERMKSGEPFALGATQLED
jgi:hypothetical protein